MSEMEFVAAIWPKRYGSSTMGVKKSTVWAMAMSPEMRITAASSAVDVPTRRSPAPSAEGSRERIERRSS
jgi:hypothetical protein